jgi:hypothetical protein
MGTPIFAEKNNFPTGISNLSYYGPEHLPFETVHAVAVLFLGGL